MKSWKLLPNSEIVSKYVECYWFLEKESQDQTNESPKLNPDPATHFIIAKDHTLHRYAHNDDVQVVQGSHWIYPHLETWTMDHSATFQIVGIKFKVGALYSLPQPNLVSMSDKKGGILDTVRAVDVHQFLGQETVDSNQLLTYAIQQKDHLVTVLDDLLLPWMLTSHEDKHSELVRHILRLLKDASITDMGAKLHRSQRTIERSFLKVTGLTMKQVHSMNRLEAVLNYLYQLNEADINWADVANQYDFSDQPHLIRYLKNSIGRTPSDYSQQRDLTIDVYGDFEIH